MLDTAKQPLVSAIVPCYNSAPYIRETLDSILGQSYRNLEVVVVNDGSTDSTPAILDEYSGRILRLDQENSGVGAARNAGISASSGELIAFCDADDVWVADKISKQVGILSSYPDVGISASLLDKIDEKGSLLEKASPREPAILDRAIDLREVLLRDGNKISLSSVVVRRRVLDMTDGFSTRDELNSEDYELWVRLSKLTKFHISSEPLIRYRVLRNSRLHGSLKKEYRPQFQCLRILRNDYSREEWRRRRSKIYHDWALSSFVRGERDAWRLMAKAVKLNPADKRLKLEFCFEVLKSILRRFL